MVSIIEFLYDPSTQTQPVSDVIDNLRSEGVAGDVGKLQLFKLVQRGLEFLEKHGMPSASIQYFTTERDDGSPYTIRLVKNLSQHVPLLEFRINWTGTGAFRATFFECPHPKTGQQILIFVRAVVKVSTFDPDFERIATETDVIYSNFMQNPEKYISFTEE